MQQHTPLMCVTSFPGMLGHWLRSDRVLLSEFPVLCFSSVFRVVWMCDPAFDPLYYTSRLLYLYDASFSSGIPEVGTPAHPLLGSRTVHRDVT